MATPREKRRAKQLAAAQAAKAAQKQEQLLKQEELQDIAAGKKPKKTKVVSETQTEAKTPVQTNVFTEHITTGATELLFNFLSSSDNPNETPPPNQGNEMAVIGRSNVGKSSLLNAIAKRTQGKNELAKTSSTPGKTRLLNVFGYKHGGQLVDLPGYGYAKISKAERNRWQERMENYLLNREYLTMVLALVDGEVGPSKQDLATMGWMLYNEIPYTVVATKIDKIKPSQMQQRKKIISEAVELPVSQIFWVSAQKGIGMEELRNYVHNQLVK